MLARLGSAFALLALLAIAILRVSRPPSPVAATAPDTVFSAERALRHVEQIAVRPHPMGSAEHDRVRDYIVAQLTQLGIKPQIQLSTGIGTRYQEAGRVHGFRAATRKGRRYCSPRITTVSPLVLPPLTTAPVRRRFSKLRVRFARRRNRSRLQVTSCYLD